MSRAAILLAAGESARMGEPKPLLPWGKATLIEYQLGELAASGLDDIVVVLGYEAERVRPLASTPGVRVVVNEGYRQGRASSLRVGAAAVPDDAEAVLVLNVDQPRPRMLLRRLLEAHREGSTSITVPTYEGLHGHPTVLAGGLLGDLRAVDEKSQGLRGLLQRHAQTVREVPFPTPLVLLDLNTPEEYERARRDYPKLLGLTNRRGGL
ncbi:MAG: nucleotidyltransferase family protein [Dehalococcoidia bacterium]